MGVAFACALLGPLASASVFDLRERRIPNKLVFAMVMLWLGLSLLGTVMAKGSTDPWEHWVRGMAGAVILGGGALLLAAAYERLTGRASMGGGDIKLLFVIGLYLGVPGGLGCLLAACVAAVVLAVVVPRTRFAQVPGSAAGQVPFAPALFAGAIAVVLASGGLLG